MNLTAGIRVSAVFLRVSGAQLLRLRRIHFHHHFAGLFLGTLAHDLRQLAHGFLLGGELDVLLAVLLAGATLGVVILLAILRIRAALALGGLLLAFALALLVGGLVGL